MKPTQTELASPQPASPNGQVLGLLFAICFPTFLTALYFVALSKTPAGWQQGVYTTGKFLQFAFPILWVRWVLRTPISGDGCYTHLLFPSLAFGSAVMLGMLILTNFWLIPFGYLETAAVGVQQKITALGINTPLRYTVLGIFYVVVHSLLEEYYWRWFVFGQLRKKVQLTPAIVLSSIAFMAHHVILLGVFFGWTTPATYLCSLAVAVGGAVWAWIYEHSGTLLGPWLSHALIDAGIFLVGFQLAGI